MADLSDRIQRAQRENLQTTIVDDDPLVVRVDNADSGRMHTVVVDSMHCSCEDHTYRDVICKHLCHVLQDDIDSVSETAQAVVEEIVTELEADLELLDSEIESLRDELHSRVEEREQKRNRIEQIRSLVDDERGQSEWTTSTEWTESDIQSFLDDLNYSSSGDSDFDSDSDSSSGADADSEFESMVRELK